MPAEDFKAEMTKQRDTIALLVGNAAQSIEAVRAADEQPGQDKNEMCANMMIGLRALEDAAMRFGKAIQASSGGKSPLGGPDTPTGVSGRRPQPMGNTAGGTAGIPHFAEKPKEE